jgi:tetraacyldisaccharide 4'-kinase
MEQDLEVYFSELVKGKRRGIIPAILKFFLRIFSWVFQVFVFLRNFLYDQGVFARYMPPVPVVISIGNIVAGGTGKTPLTLLLAEEFYRDFSIAILSRGYRSPAEKLPSPVWLSRGAGPMHPASYCGDEPFLLAKNLPKALVFVGRDRHKAANMAAKAGSHVIILDDAMQHRRLARDFELVVIDAGDPFGQGFFLPRGFLREGLKSLSRANLIILNHVESSKRFLEIKQRLSAYTKAPIIGTKMDVASLRNMQGAEISDWNEKSVGIFCGIANPDYFRKTVDSLSLKIVDSLFVRDHMKFEAVKLADFAERCKMLGAEYIVCTEKDRVKLSDTLEIALPILWLQVKLTIVEGKEYWKAFVEKAQADIKKRS